MRLWIRFQRWMHASEQDSRRSWVKSLRRSNAIDEVLQPATLFHQRTAGISSCDTSLAPMVVPPYRVCQAITLPADHQMCYWTWSIARSPCSPVFIRRPGACQKACEMEVMAGSGKRHMRASLASAAGNLVRLPFHWSKRSVASLQTRPGPGVFPHHHASNTLNRYGTLREHGYRRRSRSR